MRTELRRIALGAGEILLTHYRDPKLRTWNKPGEGPVTDADHASSRFIRDELERAFSIPVVCEERTLPWEERRLLRELWLVDPLDGTKEFLAGTDEFAVCIALVRDRYPVLGAIYVPPTRTLYWAEQGKGAFVEHDGRTEPLPRGVCPRPIAACSRFHGTDLTAEFLRLNGLTETVTVGAALKFCRLAEGTISLYPRFTGSSEWDTAAGQLLVEEVGGTMRSAEDGQRLRYNGETLRNPHFVALAPGLDPDHFRIPEARR